MLTQPALFAAGAMLALAVTVEMKLPPKATPEIAADCVAQKWVAENLENLPSTYDEFASCPVKYRKMIYAKLSPRTRAAFWRIHLDHFMASHDLNSVQKALIQKARADTTGYQQVPSAAKIDSMYAEALKVLGPQLLRDAFMSLVPTTSADLISEACSCSTVHGHCPTGYACGADGDGCDAVGCGFRNWDTCNGECLSPDEGDDPSLPEPFI